MDKFIELDRELQAKNLVGYWQVGRGNVNEQPQATFESCLWKWNEVFQALDVVAQRLGLNETFRRFIGFSTPTLGKFTTHTLLLGVQLVKPGENAEAHRHTMGAIRFVVKGHGAHTTINGEPFPMEAGDLITTPGGTWHDHANASDEPIVWLDGADAPLVRYLQVGFHEPFHQKQQDQSRPAGLSATEVGVARPSWIQRDGVQPPPYRYRWKDTEKALMDLGEGPGDPRGGVVIRFVNPLTGGPTLPTISCEMQLLRPGEETKFQRHTSTAICHVFRGKGFAVVADRRFEWDTGDSFTIPLWEWHALGNRDNENAILFVMNDRPVMEALGFHRAETK